MYIKTTEFTFHYVSIKSDALLMPLHMRHTFTFHYVSIKSHRSWQEWAQHSDLHSTMYLLNLFSRLFKSITVDKFTFHYVSIKSKTL